MQVSPQNPAINRSRRLQQVVMIVPVNPDHHEAQQIAPKHRNGQQQCHSFGSLWHLHFKHHDRDDDGDYTIAESHQSFFAHMGTLHFRIGAKHASF
jgi:hypothetical protein